MQWQLLLLLILMVLPLFRSLLVFMPRAQMFFLASYSCSQFCRYIFCFCLSSFVCVCSQIEIYTPTHFTRKKHMPNKNRFSLDTNAHKQKIFHYASFLFCFVLFPFSICCVFCAMYLEWFASFLTKISSWILYTAILNGMRTLTLLYIKQYICSIDTKVMYMLIKKNTPYTHINQLCASIAISS